MAKRYAKALKGEKGRMLDELCVLTGWTRRHARWSLVEVLKAPTARPRRPRPRTYGAQVVEPLKVVWATLNGPAGKRLAPFMAEAVEAQERHGELSLGGEVRTKLLRMSSATIDRLLPPSGPACGSRGGRGPSPARC